MRLRVPAGICVRARELVSCETQTCVPHFTSQQVQTSAFEQGASQLADDGWAEAQRKIDEIVTQLVEFDAAIDAIPDYVISSLRFQDGHNFIDLQHLCK